MQVKLFWEQGQRCQRCVSRGEKCSSLHKQAHRRVHNLHNLKRFTPILTQVEPEGFQYIAMIRQLISLAHALIENCSNNVGPTLASKQYLEKQWISLKVMNGKVNGSGWEVIPLCKQFVWHIPPHYTMACINAGYHEYHVCHTIINDTMRRVPFVPYNIIRNHGLSAMCAMQ